MNVIAPSRQSVPFDISEDKISALFSNEGILKLLVAVRGSSMPEEQKMDLRDELLEYSQLQDENEKSDLRLKVLESIQPYQAEFSYFVGTANKNNTETESPIKPAEKVQQEVSKNDSRQSDAVGFGRSRLTPTFQGTNAPSGSQSSTSTQTKDPAPAAQEVELKDAEVTEGKQPEASGSSDNAPTTPTIEVSSGLPKESPQTSVPANEHLDRIREIKSLVNTAVGNPINLIDSDNEVGREYMNALLDAMKKVSGETNDPSVVEAMSRLESAYTAVQKVIDEKNIKPEPKPETKDTAEPEKAAETVDAATELTTNKSAQAAEVVAPESKVTAEPIASVATSLSGSSTTVPESEVVNETTPPVDTNESAPQPESAVESETVPVNNTEVKAQPQNAETKSDKNVHEGLYHQAEENLLEPEETKKMSPLQRLTSRLSSRKPDPEKESVQPHPVVDVKMPEPEHKVPKNQPVSTPEVLEEAEPDKPFEPVAEVETLPEKMETLKRVIEEKEKAAQRELGDDLNDPMVNAGLEQLLSEWKLFKSSGLLGTGPNGIDHPLYKKLSQLPMASVVSGRFEGATPEIKQSITDYMNGWRYEQGMVHEMGESFEHYLRRVILFILKKQRQATKAKV